MKYDYKEIGKRLKEKRTSQQIELKDIVEEIKIFEEYLVAIEEGEIQNLPSEIYYNLFVRTYARELGLDAEKLLDDTYLGGGTDDGEQKEKKTGEPVERVVSTANTYTSPKKIFGWIAIVVLVAFLVFIAISSLCSDSNGAITKQVNPPVAIVNPEAANEINPDLDTTLVDIKDEGITVVDLNATAPITPPPLTLDIEVQELSWILILADGDTVLHRNLRPNETRQITAENNFNLSVGNPNGVIMKLNNRQMRPLSRNGRAVTNLLITQSNKENYLSIDEKINQ
ncbi:MAG: RodZ domain-containing protein [Candidatus Zixiibacteriota bacterium]